MRFLQPKQIVAVDTETSGLHFDPPEEARVFITSIAWREDGILKSWVRPTEGMGKPTWDRMLAALSRCRIVMHNAKFDMHMLREGSVEGWKGIDLSPAVFWDTMIAQRVLDPTESAGLKESAERLGLTGGNEADFAAAVQEWRKQHKHRKTDPWVRIPWDIIGPYAGQDARLTLLLAENQWARIEEGEKWAQPLIERELELLQVLYMMETRGIGFNKEACVEAAATMAKELQTAKAALPFEPTLPKAKAYFFGKPPVGLGVIPYKTTEKTGAAGLDEEVIGRLVADGVPNGKAYQRYRVLESALSKWYEAWPRMVGRDHRIRTVHSQTNVRSGRLSVSRVQLQAIPHDREIPKGVATIRSFLIPRAGYKLWELDLSNAEVRVAAAISKCKAMIEFFMDESNGPKYDIHGQTCRRMFGKEPNDPEWSKYRDIAKRVTFGTIYGGGARALREAVAKYAGVDLGPGEAESLIADYRNLYPEFYRTARRAEGLAMRRGWIRLISGRQRWFMEDEGFHKAFNAVIQGGVAEVMKDWMIEIESRLPTILLLQIHDSLVLEVPEDDPYDLPHEVARMGEEIFSRTFRFPFKVETKPWEEKV